jgi:hypothetical protein
MTCGHVQAHRQLAVVQQKLLEVEAQWASSQSVLHQRIRVLEQQVEEYCGVCRDARQEAAQAKSCVAAERGVAEQQVSVLRRQLSARGKQIEALAEKLILHKQVCPKLATPSTTVLVDQEGRCALVCCGPQAHLHLHDAMHKLRAVIGCQLATSFLQVSSSP